MVCVTFFPLFSVSFLLRFCLFRVNLRGLPLYVARILQNMVLKAAKYDGEWLRMVLKAAKYGGEWW